MKFVVEAFGIEYADDFKDITCAFCAAYKIERERFELALKQELHDPEYRALSLTRLWLQNRESRFHYPLSAQH